jgi:hypothetical protein
MCNSIASYAFRVLAQTPAGGNTLRLSFIAAAIFITKETVSDSICDIRLFVKRLVAIRACIQLRLCYPAVAVGGGSRPKQVHPGMTEASRLRSRGYRSGYTQTRTE